MSEIVRQNKEMVLKIATGNSTKIVKSVPDNFEALKETVKT